MQQARLALAMEAYAEAEQLSRKSIVVCEELGDLTSRAFALASLAYATHRQGDALQAQQHFSEALRIGLESRDFSPPTFAIILIAPVFADRNEPERAVELYALASRLYPLTVTSHWHKDVAGCYIDAAAATLPPEGVPAAEERGRDLDLWETAKALLAKLTEEVGRGRTEMCRIEQISES